MENGTSRKRIFLALFLSALSSPFFSRAQPKSAEQVLEYNEAKELLLKHKPTVESILGIKQFKFASSKERPGSTIYTYKKDNDTTQIYIRIRKTDGLVNEIAWHEVSSAIGNLTYDAIRDGFVPVAGNSRYHNRFQKMGLYVGYQITTSNTTLPCILKATE